MKTRARPTPSEGTQIEESFVATSKNVLVKDDNPPKLLILPQSADQTWRILTLPHPRSSTPTRYLYCQQTGFHELRKTRAPHSSHRSIFLTPHDLTPPSSVRAGQGQEESVALQEDANASLDNGYMLRSAEILTATPFDPLFLLLPCLVTNESERTERNGMFLSAEDLFERHFAGFKQFSGVLRDESSRSMLESRLKMVCDTVEAGDEMMYRLSLGKLYQELMSKATRMVHGGVPKSLDHHFVQKPLEVPVIGIKREYSTISTAGEPKDRATPDLQAEADTEDSTQTASTSISSLSADTADSQDSVCTGITTPDEAPQPVLSAISPYIPDSVLHLMRLRVAFSYILDFYVPPTLATSLSSLMMTSKSPDFTPLHCHISKIAEIKAQAYATRSISDFSHKRGAMEDEGVAIERAEKRRKKEEDEKLRKKNESRGVRDLKKVNVSGMKKMSQFFIKKEVAK